MIQHAKNAIRSGMRHIARRLNQASHGKITPNTVTISGFIMHAPIALLIGLGHNLWAATLLLIFGLFDTLDGELARLQKRDSVKGMLLDASTDRLKEVLLYSGAGYALALGHHPATAAWAAAACGASLSVSYVKAKGEAAVAASRTELTHAQLNRLFGGGLLSFELRMLVLIVGLVLDQLIIAVVVIAILAGFTALQRLVQISRQLA
ncbi:MAG TPA: CDP-alcohol phosphatidyltransferase family protein [Candidatus Saccharimonadia bacterium]|nr:CDP-alcohol phosphatidyltransferase family protein [Candidatus Saccharimonadia bacterium]